MLKILYFLLFFFVNGLIHAQTKSKSAFIAKIEELEKLKEISSANWGISIRKVKTGKTVFQKHEQKVLVPASTLKLITTAAALDGLGPDYKYKTYFLTDGVIEENTLKGNLIIQGSGDPSLGSVILPHLNSQKQILDSVLVALKKFGIKKVDGSIIGDGRFFESNPYPDGWQWGDIGNYYGAPISGLNFGDNQYKLQFTIKGSKTEIAGTQPNMKMLSFSNEVTPSGSSDLAYIYGGPFDTKRIVSGTIPEGKDSFTIKGSVPDPALFCAEWLTSALESNGINITKRPASDRNFVFKSTKDTLQTVYSNSLSEIVKATNTLSLNLYAEALLKTLGNQKSKKATTVAGLKEVEAFLKKNGISEGFYIHDGSGVTHFNGISPKAMTSLLIKMTGKDCFTSFNNSLPVAGVSGTLKDMCKGSTAENNLRAKSGTLTRVLCYAGYFNGKDKDLYAFSLMFNAYGFPFKIMKKHIEQLLSALTEIQ